MSGSRTVTVYGRPGCHLCDEALVALAPIVAQRGAMVEQIDIEQDEALLRAHLERIPVILVDGVEICHFFVDEPALRDALS
ncbi:MAG: glutaredoxin family protein [Patulibacter sp.]